jgi:ABC-type transport system substrate-binding protein
MSSTPGSDPGSRTRVGVAVAGVVLVGLCVISAARIPAEPTHPRYVGAGSEAPRDGGTFQWAAGSNVRSLDPHIAYDSLSYQAIRLVYDGLLDYDREGNLIPSLAKSLPEILNDGKSFRFKIRDGVRFHDGLELTADEISWSLHYMLSKRVGSPGYTFFEALVGVEAYHEGRAERVEGIVVEDPLTLRFDLERADQTFLNALALTFAYPISRRNVERLGGDRTALARSPVGVGPFVFESWERGVKLTFRRNDDYFAPYARPDEMVMWENVDATTAARRFRNGDIDVLRGAPKVHLLFFLDSEAWAPFVALEPSVSLYGITMNCELPPLDDVRVRRAVASAIDRKAITDFMLRLATPAGQPLPPQLKGYEPSLETLQAYDPARAKRELALAGYPDGLKKPIEVWIGEGEGSRNLAQLWQSDLEAVGIPVKLRQVAFATYLAETGKEKSVQMFTSGWSMDFPDPSNFLDPLFHSRSIHPQHSENRSFYRSAELDRLLDEGRGETDPEKRVALYREANALVARDAPWAFLYYPVDFEAWQPYVKGYRPHAVWSDYRSVWLDLPRRSATAEDFRGGAR